MLCNLSGTSGHGCHTDQSSACLNFENNSLVIEWQNARWTICFGPHENILCRILYRGSLTGIQSLELLWSVPHRTLTNQSTFLTRDAETWKAFRSATNVQLHWLLAATRRPSTFSNRWAPQAASSVGFPTMDIPFAFSWVSDPTWCLLRCLPQTCSPTEGNAGLRCQRHCGHRRILRRRHQGAAGNSPPSYPWLVNQRTNENGEWTGEPHCWTIIGIYRFVSSCWWTVGDDDSCWS